MRFVNAVCFCLTRLHRRFIKWEMRISNQLTSPYHYQLESKLNTQRDVLHQCNAPCNIQKHLLIANFRSYSFYSVFKYIRVFGCVDFGAVASSNGNSPSFFVEFSQRLLLQYSLNQRISTVLYVFHLFLHYEQHTIVCTPKTNGSMHRHRK